MSQHFKEKTTCNSVLKVSSGGADIYVFVPVFAGHVAVHKHEHKHEHIHIQPGDLVGSIQRTQCKQNENLYSKPT